MAGSYVDVPGVRIPYHVDGSLIRYASTTSNTVKTVSSAWTDFSNADAMEMNDGDFTDLLVWNAGSSAIGRYIGWLFPQPVAITGHNFLVYTTGNVTFGLLEYSSNTTDLTDGTWTTSSSDTTIITGSAIRDITAVSWPGVKAIRLHMACGVSGIGYLRDAAFYGTWTPATLVGWHPTLDQQIPAAHMDFGDIASGTVVKQFRIKNGRGLQANNVNVTIPAGSTQTMAGLALSLDNTTFTSSVTVTSIAAGAISPVVYLRRTISPTEPYGNVGIATVQFVASTWT